MVWLKMRTNQMNLSVIFGFREKQFDLCFKGFSHLYLQKQIKHDVVTTFIVGF